MNKKNDNIYLERLKTTFRLFDFGLQLKKQQIKRENPSISPNDLQQLLRDWLSKRNLPEEPLNE